MVDPYGLAAKGVAIGGAIGAGIGGVAGGFGGGAACTLVAPGVGTIGCGGAGAVSGSSSGAAIGGAIGAAVGSVVEDFCKSDQKERNCLALYNSIMSTCASLKGDKKRRCEVAARISYRQCLEQD